MLLPENNFNYRRLVEQLYLKCQEIQTENERCAFRLYKCKKLIKSRNKDVAILMKRLDYHNDNWRHVPMTLGHKTRKPELKRGPKPKLKTVEPKPPKAKKVKQATEKIAKQKFVNVTKSVD